MSGCCDDGTGIPGPAGPAGDSAYQIWLDEGNIGTEQDFLDSLQGVPGNQGPAGPAGATGPVGPTGADGPMGADGQDGASYLTGVGNPSNSLGNDGDTYSNNSNGEIWQKASGVWTFTGFTLKGATGSVGSQGADGFSYYTGTGIPSPSLGNDGDSYSDNTTGDIYQKVAGVWNPTGDSLLGPTGASGDDGLGYDDTTSTTSTDILDTGATTETMTWTTGKAFIAGSRVRIADSSNPSANYFEGVVNTYDVVTGNAIVESVNVKVGTGTLASWNISIAGEQGGAASTPAWSAVLATGATSGVNDPIIDAGQKLGINGGTTNAVEYNTFVSNVPQLKGLNGAAITDGVDTSVEVDNVNAKVTTPLAGAMVLPSSNNPTVDVSSPIEGMIKTRTQAGNKDIEAYINGSWRSLTSGGDTNGIGKWEYVTNTLAPPLTGEIRFDNATIGSATNLYVFDTDNDGVDKGSILNILSANDYFYIQQVDNVNNFALVEFSSVTDNTTYVTYGINSITVVGSFSASDKFFIVPISKGGGGGSNTNIIANDLTQTAKRTQVLDGNTQDWQDGIFSLTDVTVVPNVVNLGNTGTTLTVDMDVTFGNMYTATATDNFTLNFSNPKAGIFYLKMIQDVTGSRVLTLGTNTDSPGGVTPLLTTTANAKDWLTLLSDGTNVSVFVANDLQ